MRHKDILIDRMNEEKEYDILESLTPKKFQFFLDNDKLPYFTFPYKFIRDGKDNSSLIEVSVDAMVCQQLIYAGVQYGIDKMAKLNSEIKAA